MNTWLRQKLLTPILNQLRQGITPEKIALSLAFGICLGVFPVLGSTVLLCTLASVLFRLNLPTIQLVNYLVYPLQFALFMPFIRLGEILFRVKHIPFSLTQLMAMLRTDPWGTIRIFWATSVHAVVAWMLVGPLAIYLIYRVLRPFMEILAARRYSSSSAFADTGAR